MDKATISAVLMDKIMITILLFILISVPFIVFQDKIATWLSSTVEEADNKKEEKENSMSQNIYTLLMLLHTPLFLNTILTSPYLFIYVVAYIVAGSGVLMVDPWGMITSNNFSNLTFVGTTFLAYMTLIAQSYSVINLFCIIALCVSFTNIIRQYTDDSKFLVYFLLYTIPYCIAYLFALRPSLIQSIRDMNNPGAGVSGPSIEMNNTLLLCVLFFVLLFYSTTFFRTYYGGEVLVRDPIKLSVPTEITIKPSYNYTLSYCVYIDSTPPEYNVSTTYHSNVVSCGHEIQTKYESSTQSFRVVTKSPTLNIFEAPLLSQRWNHVVLVCNQGQLDIYLNGEIVGTTHTLSPTDKYMLIGQLGGIKGKICSVLYSTEPLSNAMVNQLYLQLKTQDPPIL
jgi:hypothetical protein